MLLLPAIAIGALIIEAETAMRASIGPRLKKTDEAICMFRCVVQDISTDERRIAFCQRIIVKYRKVTKMTADEWKTLSLKQRVDRINKMIETGEISEYVKSINSSWPNPLGRVGVLADEAAFYNPQLAAIHKEWFK